jgi:hypothetical protein
MKIQNERPFLNSIGSEYIKNHYRIHLQKYFDASGSQDTEELLSRDHKEIENEIIELIIAFKEKRMKRATMSNYINQSFHLQDKRYNNH